MFATLAQWRACELAGSHFLTQPPSPGVTGKGMGGNWVSLEDGLRSGRGLRVGGGVVVVSHTAEAARCTERALAAGRARDTRRWHLCAWPGSKAWGSAPRLGTSPSPSPFS
eukprot:2722063-Pleurochrysis_carterae.AAC.1